jgi:hypothetical protein
VLIIVDRMRIELTSETLQVFLAEALEHASPLMKPSFHSGFYRWFVPHHLLTCTSEQGPKQSTLGHLSLSVWVANPMEPRFLSSVQVGLLSVSFYFSTLFPFRIQRYVFFFNFQIFFTICYPTSSKL